jgi:hypothetical protein
MHHALSHLLRWLFELLFDKETKQLIVGWFGVIAGIAIVLAGLILLAGIILEQWRQLALARKLRETSFEEGTLKVGEGQEQHHGHDLLVAAVSHEFEYPLPQPKRANLRSALGDVLIALFIAAFGSLFLIGGIFMIRAIK